MKEFWRVIFSVLWCCIFVRKTCGVAQEYQDEMQERQFFNRRPLLDRIRERITSRPLHDHLHHHHNGLWNFFHHHLAPYHQPSLPPPLPTYQPYSTYPIYPFAFLNHHHHHHHPLFHDIFLPVPTITTTTVNDTSKYNLILNSLTFILNFSFFQANSTTTTTSSIILFNLFHPYDYIIFPVHWNYTPIPPPPYPCNLKSFY